MTSSPQQDRPLRPIDGPTLQWFVDREGALSRFRAILEGHCAALGLAVTGPEGIGKTWLLARLHQEARARAVPVVNLSFAAGNTFDFFWLVRALADGLGTKSFPTLDKTLIESTKYRVEGVGPVNGQIVFHERADIDGGNVFVGNMLQLRESNPDTRRIWREYINRAFFADLEQLAATRKAVILFDTMDRATEEACSWITGELLARLGAGRLPGIYVGLAGETLPELPSTLHGSLIELQLDPLPAAAVRLYLRDKRGMVISEETVQAIYDATGGQPDLVAMIEEGDLEHLSAQPTPDQVWDVLAERIVRRTSEKEPEERLPLFLAAIPQWFDAPLLAALLGDSGEVAGHLDHLAGQRYVEPEPGAADRWHVRGAVRKRLLRTWAREPLKFAQAQQRAADHWAERAAGTQDPIAKEEFQRQEAAHRLIADESNGCQRVCQLFEQAEAEHREALCEQLLKRADEVNLVDKAGCLSGSTLATLRYLWGRLALLQNSYGQSEQQFGTVMQDEHAGPELRALARWGLGQAAAEQGAWVTAEERYQGSLAALSGPQAAPERRAQVLLSLGDLYSLQAAALGGAIEAWTAPRGARWALLALPRLVVALPFLLWARAVRQWRLPPLQHLMSYQNWTLTRLLLSAEQSYLEAERMPAAADAGPLLADVRRGLALVYHQMGRWRFADEQFAKAEQQAGHEYARAQLNRQHADMLLAAGEPDRAQLLAEQSLDVFRRYKDIQAEAEARALLAQALMQKGDLEAGLAAFGESLAGLERANYRPGIGLVLHRLRACAQRCGLDAQQQARVQKLIADTPERVFLARVPDKLATSLRWLVSAGLVALVLGAIGLFPLVLGLSSVTETWARLLAFETWLRLLLRLLLAAWAWLAGSVAVGLLLVHRGAKSKVDPKSLDTLVLSAEGIGRHNPHTRVETFIKWEQVRAGVSVQRAVWKKPSGLLSHWRVYGDGAGEPIRVPATISGYADLVAEIEGRLRERHTPVLHWDLSVLRSRLGLCLALSPGLEALATLFMYNTPPSPAHLAAVASPLLVWAQRVTLVAGPYWWLALYPLWVHYHLRPRSRLPWVVGGMGLASIAIALLMDHLRPFFPVLFWLDTTLHPLGFVLALAAGLWVLGARQWEQEPVKRAKAAFRPAQRALAAVALVGTLLLGGMFVWSQWVPYRYILPAISDLYHGLPQVAITGTTQGLAINPAVPDGYFFRAAANKELGDERAAVEDLSRIIDCPYPTHAFYRIYRAGSLWALGDCAAARQDLQAALNARSWPLSETRRKAALEKQEIWAASECGSQ